MKLGIAVVLLVVACASSPAAAQQSASYRIVERTINSGGDPRNGLVLQSSGFRVTLDAIGEPIPGLVQSGVSFSVQGGIVPAVTPPGEVQELRFLNATTLAWNVEPRAADYALYQGSAPLAGDPGYGICRQPPPPITAESAAIPEAPPVGQIRFYLVTARSSLGEEGTKGYSSSGVEHPNSQPCP